MSALASENVVVVLGMHRSGTSLCMSILNALGVELDGDLVAADRHNPLGYFESRDIVDLNDRILLTLGLTWHSLLSVALKDDWLDDPILVPAKEQLAQIVRQREAGNTGKWGIKDPRISLLLPLYEEVFSSCGVTPAYVLCLRDPRSVALSLARRDRFPAMFSELLWLENTMRALQIGRASIRAVVNYEDWFRRGPEQLDTLIAGLELSVDRRVDSPAEILSRLVTPSLDHGSDNPGKFELAATESIYTSLKEGDFAAALDVFKEVQQTIRLTAGQKFSGRGGREDRAGITYQLFWRTSPEEPFSEINSSRVFTTPSSSRCVVQLPIPAGAPSVAGLRLDPSDAPGLARLYSIRLRNSCNEVLWEWDGRIGTLLACERYNLSLSAEGDELGVIAHFHNDDPGLVLPLSQEANKLSRTGGVLEVELAWISRTRAHGTGD